MKDAYWVKNISKCDISLGELLIKIPVGKTMDLLKAARHMTMEKLLQQENNEKSTLNKSLRKKMLVKIENKSEAKTVRLPTIFEADVEEITFPRKVKTGVVMEERPSILDSEIVNETPKPLGDVVEPQKIDDDSVIMVAKENESSSVSVGAVLVPATENNAVTLVRKEESDEATLKEAEKEAEKEALEQDRIQKKSTLDVKEKRVKKTPIGEGNIKRVEEQEVIDLGDVDLSTKDGMFTLTPKGEEKESFLDKDVIKEAKEKVNPVIEKNESGMIKVSEVKMCKAMNRFGKPCRAKALKDSDYCMVHKMQK